MEKYRVQRRLTGPAYTADSMKDLEPNLDKILSKDIRIMRDRAGQSIDVDIFFNMFASGKFRLYIMLQCSLILSQDCLSTATFSKPKNLVEADKDDGSIKSIHNAWKYMHVVGYFPFFHRLLTWYANRISSDWLRRINVFFLPAVFRKRDRAAAETTNNPFAVRSTPLGSHSHF